MKGDYDFAEWKVVGAVAMVEHWDKGNQLWVWILTRKEHKCCVTGEWIPRRDAAFRPITNADNRADRISVAGMNNLIDRYGLSNQG